ncbi:hypothetical protein [Corynebacterium sp. Marseille-P4321]|uniref:hypothetical protein n=1 Tax=Corynebacterium sp. Marseille-P4321 TaxID=2736603 RepID=UPI000892A99C|nr:hypothetical protein [Corynebacterium sp. Marseille-P4321]OEX92640.1 hypothetical protein A0K93_10665 [Corynebacterium sp. BCW_4722]
MGEVLRAAFECIEVPSLTERELKILTKIAQRADDRTGPDLGPDGAVRECTIGYVDNALGSEQTTIGGLQADSIRLHMPVFYATGWVRAIDNPALDGAHQLNIARLTRMLDAQLQDAGSAEADSEQPGDFEAAVPSDLTELVDTLLIKHST